jgi:hypothetical protein
MKHATSAALDRLERLVDELRKCAGLKEKSRGVFYRKSSAFLHFHEDPAGLFADVRLDGEWERCAVNTEAERRSLLARVKTRLRAKD